MIDHEHYYITKVLPEIRAGLKQMREEDPETFKAKRTEYLLLYLELVETVKDHVGKCLQETPPDCYSTLNDEILWDKLDRKATRIRQELASLKAGKGARESLTNDMIIQAKAYPIDNLIQFNRSGFAKCIWHDDKKPSLHYWKEKNIVKCFACGESGDAIKVYMDLNGVKFHEAVKALI